MYKFRALKDDISNCHFVYGNLIFKNKIPRIQNKETDTFYTCFSGTEGIFTTQKDSDSIDIYVGDILKCDIGANEIIEFKNGSFFCRRRNISLYELLTQEEQGFVRVIGNIHEDPHLMTS